jgi:hypothetical protein
MKINAKVKILITRFIDNFVISLKKLPLLVCSICVLIFMGVVFDYKIASDWLVKCVIFIILTLSCYSFFHLKNDSQWRELGKMVLGTFVGLSIALYFNACFERTKENKIYNNTLKSAVQEMLFDYGSADSIIKALDAKEQRSVIRLSNVAIKNASLAKRSDVSIRDVDLILLIALDSLIETVNRQLDLVLTMSENDYAENRETIKNNLKGIKGMIKTFVDTRHNLSFDQSNKINLSAKDKKLLKDNSISFGSF